MPQTGLPLIGLCPIGKFVFSHSDALRWKLALQKMLKRMKVRFTDLENVLPDGMVRDQQHVDAAVGHFRNAGIDGLFLPHCNFGTEGAAGTIAAQLNLPTLLWGPRDEAPEADGTRLRDTLCGLMATSNVLHKLGIRFTYLPNDRLADPSIERGIDVFTRAVRAASAFRKGFRIGMVGQRIDFFWTTIINESELLNRFKIEILPLDMVSFINDSQDRARRGRAGYIREARRLRRAYNVEDFEDDTPLINILAVRDQLLALGEEHGLEGFAIQDFPSLPQHMGTYCFLADGMLAEKYAVGYESDIHGTISAVIAGRLNYGRSPAFLADVTVRHPDDDNGVLLWHCGAPPSMKHPDIKPRLGRHWILPEPIAGMPHYRLQDGPVTVLRFDGDPDGYRLAIGEGHSMDGPHTLNNYVWLKVDDWPRWEKTLIEGPFIHHVSMTYGHYGDAAVEACRYIAGLEPVVLNSSHI